MNFNLKNNLSLTGGVYSYIFIKMLTTFTNLRCLKFNPSSSFNDALSLSRKGETLISSTLLELHVTVEDMRECLYILDGRFDQLRILYVTFEYVFAWLLKTEHKVGYFY